MKLNPIQFKFASHYRFLPCRTLNPIQYEIFEPIGLFFYCARKHAAHQGMGAHQGRRRSHRQHLHASRTPCTPSPPRRARHVCNNSPTPYHMAHSVVATRPPPQGLFHMGLHLHSKPFISSHFVDCVLDGQMCYNLFRTNPLQTKLLTLTLRF
jgi:hypothetical protein